MAANNSLDAVSSRCVILKPTTSAYFGMSFDGRLRTATDRTCSLSAHGCRGYTGRRWDDLRSTGDDHPLIEYAYKRKGRVGTAK